MHSRALERPGTIARREQGPHEMDSGFRGIRVGDDELSPPLGGPARLTRRFLGEREALERGSITPGDVAPRLLHPALEFRGIAEMEAVEERPPIEHHGRLPLAATERSIELVEITADDCRVQTEGIGSREDGFAELPAHLVDELLEGVPGLLSTFRPEIEQDLVPTHPPLTDAREQGEQRQPAALGEGSRPSAVGQCQSAERFKQVHLGPAESSLRGI